MTTSIKLNHLNLVVIDVAVATHLFETYFNFKCTGTKGDNIIAILKGADNFTLVLMRAKESKTYPDGFHIGFFVDTADQVNEIYLKLKNGGIAIGQEPKKIRDSFGFYFNFDNLMIEVSELDKRI